MIDVFTYLLALFALIALHLLPGLAVLKWLWRGNALSWSEQAALALGVGVALPPLLLELAHLIDMAWSSRATIIYLIVSLAALAVWLLRTPRTRRREFLMWHACLLLLLFAAALAVRLYVVRDLPVGLWGDSYQHTMIAQLLVDNGGLFSSWAPYAPLATLTYHYGFHANVALLHWLTDIPVTQSVLLMGQWLNALSVPLAYVLTTRAMRGSQAAPFAGLCTALLTGFLNTQPAYYVNWGRYTQLTGQIILPVVVIGWMALADMSRLPTRRGDWLRMAMLTSLMTACLMLTHYIVTLFAALFVGTYLLATALRRFDWRAWLRLSAWSSLTALAAVVLAMPWLLNTLNGYLLRNTSAFVNGAVSADRIAAYSSLPTPTPFFIKDFMVVLAAVGLLWSLVRRDWRVALLAVWTGLLVVTIRPQLLGLPGAGVVDYFTVYIALYLTVIPLAAYPLGLLAELDLARRIGRITANRGLMFIICRLARWRYLMAVALMLMLTIWGVSWQQNIVDVNYELLTPADWRAMAWIRANTPADARFLVNAFPAFGGTLIAGSDGGWWIPLLARRQTNLPPLTYGSEQASPPDVGYHVNTLAESLRGRPLTDATPVLIDLSKPEALQALRAAGMSYVYNGAHASPGPPSADHFDVQALRISPAWQLIYSQDGVEIFQIVNPE